MKFYIVTQGCGEDFSIVKLFTTEEQAKAFCDEQFEKRAKQVAIDKYSEWKAGKIND